MNATHMVASRAENAPNSATYEELRQRHVQTLLERIPAHFDRLSWSAEQLRAERQIRLRELLRFAWERSPWHRRRLAHLDPNALSEGSLDQLPTMTKDDLMENFDEIVTDRRITLDLVESHLASLTSDAYLLGRYRAVASGGSCGRRGVFVWDWDAWADLYLGIHRFGLRERSRSPELQGKPVVAAGTGAGHPTHASNSLFRTFSNPALTYHLFPVTLPVEQVVLGLNRVQPEYFVGYASALHALALEAQKGRLHITPRALISAAEPLLPETRTLLEATWHVPVINVWASSEGATAAGCGYGPHMHLNDDLLIVEPVDAEGRPVPPGVPSAKLYLTNLYNLLLPLIRYEITDEITLLDETCPCGCAHRLVGDVQGRLDDSFVYAGVGSLHPHRFRSSLGRDQNIIEYQVLQTTRGASIKVRCCGPVDLAGLRAGLLEELKQFGLASPDISVHVVETLQRHAASGKLKRFIPLAN